MNSSREQRPGYREERDPSREGNRGNESDYAYGETNERSQGIGAMGNSESSPGRGSAGSQLDAQSGEQSYGFGYGGMQDQEPQGRYAGRGPKGYRRSDERILENLYDQLTIHSDVDATQIEARVEGGHVTLEGIVEDDDQKHMAEAVARRVSGVEAVANHIRVVSASVQVDNISGDSGRGIEGSQGEEGQYREPTDDRTGETRQST